MPAASNFGALPGRAVQKRPTAFLTLQEGCDKFCTYCVVPYTRGAEISSPWAAIMDEAKALIDAGVSEITLLGQNVTAWPGEDEAGRPQGLDDTIRALAGIAGFERIRYPTRHPNHMTAGISAAPASSNKLQPSINLPVLSGSSE